ncbi:hypothetical protein ACC732_37345, partial [Rhizobium ruizarguesonis]
SATEAASTAANIRIFMSSPPSLKRCRDNLDQSISPRTCPQANFSAITRIAPFGCFHPRRRIPLSDIQSAVLAPAFSI